jgi:prenyl protein peptidase
MGYFPIGWEEIVKTLGLTALLFLGPLFEAGIAEGQWKRWVKLRGLNAVISGWIGWRNYIAVKAPHPLSPYGCWFVYQGPITEEVLFRSCSVPLLLLSHTSNTKIIFLTPIIFGLAHVHHFYEFRITHPHTPIAAAIARSLLQFTYTTLFGGYATFIYLRTSSLVSCVVVHTFCNFMGFPRFWGRVTAGEETIIGPDVGDGKRDDRKDSAGSGELGVVWTIVYYTLLAAGAVGWWKCLWVLTESESSLTDFK